MWLEGKWLERKQEKISTETWAGVSANTMEGRALVIKNGKPVHSETMRLVEMSGDIFYLAKVAQNSLPIPFKLIVCSNKQFFFENLEHDFPKRIDYTIVDDTNMRVDVSDGKDQGFSINYTRQKQGDPSGSP